MSVSSKDMWKQNESKNGDAIIAVAEDGSASLIILFTTEEWKREFVNDIDGLFGECQDIMPGLYYANIILYRDCDYACSSCRDRVCPI